MIKRVAFPAAAVILLAACQSTPNTGAKPAPITPERALYDKALAAQEGRSGPVDLKAGQEMMEQAAAAGSVDAMHRLGDMYGFGDAGVPKDYTKALDWYKKAAAYGDTHAGYGALAMFSIGAIYENGYGLAKDQGIADVWYHKAMAAGQTGAHMGIGSAQIALALMFSSAKGVKEDDVSAWHWATEALKNDEPTAQHVLGLFYGQGQGIDPNTEEMFRHYLRAAQLGVADDMVNTSLGYMEGNFAPKDVPTAMEWLNRAIDRGYARALRVMGVYYHEGHGVERNDATARDWYQKAIAMNDEVAYGLMGLLYYGDNARQHQPAEAATWFQKGAAAGDAASMYWLAMMYLNGESVVPADSNQAVQWLRSSADKGYPRAMTRLGQLYELGKGVNRSDETALDWYRKASANGDDEGMDLLALMLERQQQNDEARGWLFRASQDGYGVSMRQLGEMYETGGAGLKMPDLVVAFSWYHRAADAGDVIAMRKTAELLMEGRAAPRDYITAREYLQKAIAANDKKALVDLGMIYENGWDVAKDTAQARTYYSQAAAAGEAAGTRQMGHLYQEGIGVEKNPSRAIILLKQAANAGDVQALEMLAQTYELGKGVTLDNKLAREYYVQAARPPYNSKVARDWLNFHPQVSTNMPLPTGGMAP